jgi:hypothetical protein
MTKSEITFYIIKGVTDHFKRGTLNIKFFSQDLIKTETNLPSWVEQRLVGPDFYDKDAVGFRVELTVNVLISTMLVELNNDYLAHLRNVARALVPFEDKTIHLDTGECMTRNGKTVVRNYGSTDDNNLVVHSIIESSYYLEQEY